MNSRELLNEMAEAEDRFLGSVFVAPVLRGQRVRVRVCGIVLELAVTPPEYEGWAVLRPLDHGRARVVEEAKLSRVREYLALFPAVSLILCDRGTVQTGAASAAPRKQGVPTRHSMLDARTSGWRGLPAEDSGAHIRTEGPVTIELAQGVQLFDAVRTRWDGGRFLFEAKNTRRDPSVAAYLRESLAEMRPPDALQRRTLSRQERTAYEWQYLLAKEDLRDATEERLRQAVAHADGRFLSFIERTDVYTVTFAVNGQTHTSTIRKDNLSVMLAGICLSGEDAKFDLASLVGVIREGQDGRIVRVGTEGGLDEAVYRRVHPPRRQR